MKNVRSPKGRGLFYSRDSGGKHEQTPAQYVEWARKDAEIRGVKFDGTGEHINEMIRNSVAVSGDIFFDYCVQGHLLNRLAFDSLFETARSDLTVSHIYIPKRERFARPHDPVEAVTLEDSLRKLGITIVYGDKVLPPLATNRRRDIAETIVSCMEYDQAGRFRQDLATKMIFAQLQLAKHGYSTGGRAPYGFRRHLVRPDGSQVRQLADGEVVRIAGHHVVWLPGPKEEVELALRIRSMLLTLKACRVAKLLTSEKVPSPDATRMRTDNGVKHYVSGVWHQSTVVNIGRNPLFAAIVAYGRRSMGDQLRTTPNGPRPLEEHDLRQDGKPKVIRNPDDALTTAPARFQPLTSPQQHDNLVSILNVRGGSQRGKPRSRDPGKNPLGCRIHDLNCSWPMYRQPYSKTYRYVCGLYQQSHGQECSHNHVDGPRATRVILATLHQRLLSPGQLNRLEQKIRQRARDESPNDAAAEQLKTRQRDMDQVQSQLAVVQRNMAMAASEDQFRSISAVFDELKKREAVLKEELVALSRQRPENLTTEQEVDVLMGELHRLKELAGEENNLPAITELFERIDVQLYAKFKPVQKKKRVENHLTGGMITWGDVPSPIQKYEGPTSRRGLRGTRTSQNPLDDPTGAKSEFTSGSEDKSLGNVSRGDRI